MIQEDIMESQVARTVSIFHGEMFSDYIVTVHAFNQKTVLHQTAGCHFRHVSFGAIKRLYPDGGWSFKKRQTEL